ncbi:MAG: tetratricopeptide repeat protein [Candidatus Omnitrophica bacterium]|nr:tetratricopeptide repeat protein [Candidatus Omnitrophota bacterium]
MWEDILRKKDDLEYPTQYVLLGQTYLLKGNFNKAIRAYQKALRLEPERPKAQLFLANAWFKKAVNSRNATKKEREKCLYKALVHYNKANTLSPRSIIGEWARKQIREVDNSVTSPGHVKSLKELSRTVK